MSRTYKIRKFANGRNKSGNPFVNYSLTLPTPLAEKLIESFDEETLAFEIELTAEGILYKPVAMEQVFPDTLPFKAGKRTAAAVEPAPNGKPGSGAKVPAKAATKPKAAAGKAKPAPKAAPRAPKAPGKPVAAKPAPKAAKAAPKVPARPKAPVAKAGPKAPAKPRAPRKPVAA